MVQPATLHQCHVFFPGESYHWVVDKTCQGEGLPKPPHMEKINPEGDLDKTWWNVPP